jgi:tetratricopeptide (TPR) repeat protein
MSSKPHSGTNAFTQTASLNAVATLALAALVFVPTCMAQSAPGKTEGAAKNAATTATAADSDQADRAQSYYHYMLAHEYEEMATTTLRPEYSTRAVEEYKLALNNDPNSKFLNAGLAELYFRTGHVRDAILAAQDQIKRDPNNLEAHKLLGSIYLKSLGDGQQGSASDEMLKLAIGEYSKIVSLEPDNIEDRLLLGQLYSFSHDSQHAEEQFAAAKKIDPGSEDTALNMARLYIEQGDAKRAIAALSDIPDEDKTTKTEFVLGSTYERMKDPKHAIEAYRKSLDLDPGNLEAERALAKALLADNQFTPALQAFKDIAAGDPSDAEAYLRISEIERRQGSYEEALTTLKKAKSLASDTVEISFNEGLLDDALGRYDDAAQIFEKLASDSEHTSGQYSSEEKNDRALFLERLAVIYGEQNQPDKAAATYQKIIALGGEYSEQGYEAEIDTFREAHQYDKATQIARDAVAKDPKNRGMKLTLAMQLADNGHAEEGIAIANSLLTKGPTDYPVYRALAMIYTRLRKWKDAAEAIDQADQLTTKPEEKVDIHFLRGTLFERQQRIPEAESEFRAALTIDPKNSSTLNYLGYMLADHDMKLDEALAMVQKAVELDPQNYAFLDSLGWAYFKVGKYNQAEEDLRKAVERNSTDATVHDHLGELYEKTGRLKLAASQWEESLNEYQKTISADIDPGAVGKVQKRLDSARVRLAKESSLSPSAAAKP